MKTVVITLLFIALTSVGDAAPQRPATQPSEAIPEVVSSMAIDGIKLEVRAPLESPIGKPGQLQVSFANEGKGYCTFSTAMGLVGREPAGKSVVISVLPAEGKKQSRVVNLPGPSLRSGGHLSFLHHGDRLERKIELNKHIDTNVPGLYKLTFTTSYQDGLGGPTRTLTVVDFPVRVGPAPAGRGKGVTT